MYFHAFRFVSIFVQYLIQRNMKQNTKDWMQHTSAMALIASAIAMGFLCFLTTQEIGTGPLTYIGEALSAALLLFGVTNYFANKVTEFKDEIRRELQTIRKEDLDHEER